MANREQEIFCAALERTAEPERAAYLDAACAGQLELRGRVEALLRAADAAGGFLDEAQAVVRETTGAQIGRYVLRDRIGEGGFGVVYLAEQEQPVRRTVALKIIKLGMDTRAVVARFEAERQALAMMDHPNIARVLDGGATETGRPYFVMELVRGAPVTTFCDERRLGLRERLELFLQVCRAVRHAHQKGIIHRDLKPSNILITLEGDAATAKVIDFGIAKATHEPLTEKTLVSRQHVFVGTPAYMSPEQVGLGDLDIDVRSDLYSLGALLYELLAGFPVLDAKALLVAGYAEVQRAIHHGEPLPPSLRVASLEPGVKHAVAERRRCTPSRLVGELHGDLDRIVGKCLEKDRTRRYETAEDLAQDVMRYLRSEPVLARPATLGYRAAKFVRRHRRGVIAATLMILLLVDLGGYHLRRLAVERDLAQLEARKAAKVSEVLRDLLLTADPYRTPTPEGALEASAARVRQEFATEPEVRVEILNTIGRVYLRRGEQDKARAILTESLAVARLAGPPDLKMAQALSDLGILQSESGDTAGAVAYLEEALAIRRRLLGTDHNDVAVSLVELGRVERMLDQFDRAEQLAREALAIRRRVLGQEHREVAVSLGDLAIVLWLKGDLAGAAPLFEQSIAMYRRTLGTDHPNYGQALANFAALKVDQNDLPAAEALLREALAIVRRSFGEQHWRTARTLGSLGAVWRGEGRLDDAATALDKARANARTGVGVDNPLIAVLEIERARVHLDQGQPAAAEPLLQDALRIQQLAYPENGWRVASTKSLLGAALLGQGKTAEAEPLLREASQVLKEIPGPQGRETKPTRERLALLASAHG